MRLCARRSHGARRSACRKACALPRSGTEQATVRMRAMLAQALFISFAVALGCLALLLSRFGRAVLDRPNERSLHQHPVPRTGGVAVVIGAAAAMAIGAQELWLPFGLAGALAAVSFIDDLRSLPTSLRLACHLAAAGLICWYLLSPMHPLALAVLVL